MLGPVADTRPQCFEAPAELFYSTSVIPKIQVLCSKPLNKRLKNNTFQNMSL